MQITRERIVGEIAKLNGERVQHLAQIEQIAANVNACDGALIQCRAMLALLDTPEPQPEAPYDPTAGSKCVPAPEMPLPHPAPAE